MANNESQGMADEMQNLLVQLFPIYRSLTGDGNRETLDIIANFAPIKQIEYPSGTKVFDWTVPDEYSVKEAWIKNS